MGILQEVHVACWTCGCAKSWTYSGNGGRGLSMRNAYYKMRALIAVLALVCV